MLTQEYLRAHLHYNPETGIFTRIKENGTAHIGDIAGTLSQTGYIYISVKGKGHRAHRLVWLYLYGKFPDRLIDHINGIRHDNRLCNLRECSKAENTVNSKIDKRNKLGFKGVRKSGNNFSARATIDYKEYHLGNFKTKEEASDAYINFVKSFRSGFERRN